MPTEISQEVLREARKILADRRWDTRETHLESGEHLHLGVYPSPNGGISVLFIPFKGGDVFPGMWVRVKISGEEHETGINVFGEAVFPTLPAGLAEIELG